MSDKRVSAAICPICDGAVLAPESILSHLHAEHGHHPCAYPGCQRVEVDESVRAADAADQELWRAESFGAQMEVARDAAVSERGMAMATVAAVAKALADLRNDEMSDLEHYHLDSRFREFASRVRALIAAAERTEAPKPFDVEAVKAYVAAVDPRPADFPDPLDSWEHAPAPKPERTEP